MKEFISENRGLVRAIIRKLTGSYNEDIEQEVYIKTWRSLGSYQEEGRFRQWVATLTGKRLPGLFQIAGIPAEMYGNLRR